MKNNRRYQRRYYQHSGLSIASDVDLPEWSLCEQAALSDSPDVVIQLGPLVADDQEKRASNPRVTGQEIEFVIPGTGKLFVRRGSEIEVRLTSEAEAAEIRPWLLGRAWGALCYQRGLFLIHASAVRIGEEAVLFCGEAGSGKSTLAAQLNARGYSVIGDDLCRIDLSPEAPPVVLPSAPRIKLWSDAIGELSWNGRSLAPDHLREGKFHLAIAPGNVLERIPVAAAFSLHWGEFQIQRLEGLAALRAFLKAATWRKRLLDSLGGMNLHSQKSIEFLKRVPFAELSRPRDFGAASVALDFLTGGRQSAAL